MIGKTMSRSDIEDRWRNRIVPNGWNGMGEEGAKLYLKKYGRNISEEKLRNLANCAREHSCLDMAKGFDDAVKDIYIVRAIDRM